MNQALAGFGPGVALRGNVAEARAHGDHQVGRGEGSLLMLRVRQTHVAGIERMIVRKQILPAETNGHRQLPAFGELHQRLPATGTVAITAGQQDRPLGRTQHGGQTVRRFRRWGGIVGQHGARHRQAAFLPQHVLGQGQHGRAGHAGQHRRPGAGQQFGNLIRVRRLADELRHAVEHAGIVDLLERPGPQVTRLHLPDDQQHRNRVLLRRVHGDRGVARARPPADQGHAGPAGEARVGHRHEAGPALLPGGHQIDAGMGVQRIHDGDVAFAGNVEAAVDAILRQERHEYFC